MSRNSRVSAVEAAAESQDNPSSNLVWGAEAIGREINRNAPQVRYLFGIGFFQGAVWKAGHRTYVGNRQRLRDLVNN